jgi:hypothetical protein
LELSSALNQTSNPQLSSHRRGNSTFESYQKDLQFGTNTLQRNQKKVVYQVQQRTTQATEGSGNPQSSNKEISLKNFNGMKLHPQTLNNTPRDQG